MKNIVFTSYSGTPQFNDPVLWLKRIRGYTGILEQLGEINNVTGIERINYEGELECKGVRYFFMRLNKRVIRFPIRMHRLIARLQPDVVFINGFIFPFQILQLKLYLRRGVKIIVLHRAEKPFKGLKRYIQRMADKCVDYYMFASSEFGDEWLKAGIIIDNRKIVEIIQASSVFSKVNKATAREAVGVYGSPVFLWVGRLDVNKDPLTVVEAFINFLSSQPGATLYMIYQSGELLQRIQQLIAGSDCATRAIKLVGAVPHEHMESWYNSADFILSGSHYEGSGVAVSEAMSCGCIPVVTSIPSFRRMTGPGKCGFLFNAGDTGSLYDALLKTKDIDIQAESARALGQFHSELSFAAIAHKIEQLIAGKETKAK